MSSIPLNSPSVHRPAIEFPPTPASKHMLTSSSDEWPSKRRRMTRAEERSRAHRYSTKRNRRSLYLHPNSPLEHVSPLSSTQFMTPPNSCELPCSPSPSERSWVAVAGSSPSGSNSQDSDESTIIPRSCLDLVPTIMSFPVPPVHNDMTPSPSISKSIKSSASSEICTPPRALDPPASFRGFEDTFGKRPDIEAVQLSEETCISPGASALPCMLIPRGAWCLFKPFPSEYAQHTTRLFVYRGGNGRGQPITIHNEDLWMDEENPFLLTRFDLGQDTPERVLGTIIPTTSSLHLLSNSTSMWN